MVNTAQLSGNVYKGNKLMPTYMCCIYLLLFCLSLHNTSQTLNDTSL